MFGDYVKGGLPYASLGSFFFFLKKGLYLRHMGYIFLVVVCEI